MEDLSFVGRFRQFPELQSHVSRFGVWGQHFRYTEHRLRACVCQRLFPKQFGSRTEHLGVREQKVQVCLPVGKIPSEQFSSHDGKFGFQILERLIGCLIRLRHRRRAGCVKAHATGLWICGRRKEAPPTTPQAQQKQN